MLSASQCDFATYPSTAKFLVADGSAKRMPSSSGLAITWQPRRDLIRDRVSSTKISSFIGLRKKIHIRLSEPKSKVQHIIFFIHRIFHFVVVVYILNRAFHIKLNIYLSQLIKALCIDWHTVTITWHVEHAREPSHAPGKQGQNNRHFRPKSHMLGIYIFFVCKTWNSFYRKKENVNRWMKRKHAKVSKAKFNRKGKCKTSWM